MPNDYDHLMGNAVEWYAAIMGDVRYQKWAKELADYASSQPAPLHEGFMFDDPSMWLAQWVQDQTPQQVFNGTLNHAAAKDIFFTEMHEIVETKYPTTARMYEREHNGRNIFFCNAELIDAYYDDGLSPLETVFYLIDDYLKQSNLIPRSE